MHAVYTWHMVLLNRARGQFEFLEGLDKYNPSETIALAATKVRQMDVHA